MRPHSSRTVRAAIPRHLADAVRAQATYGDQADRVGAFLSGGTDSSAISLLLGEALAAPGTTFSIGFAEEDFNESGYAHLAAHRFRADHHEYFVTAEDTAAFLPQLAHAYDEPFGNSSAIAAYHCAKLAREAGVDTLLAGDGGDELFGGNTRYVTNRDLRDLPSPAAAGSARAASNRCCSACRCPTSGSSTRRENTCDAPTCRSHGASSPTTCSTRSTRARSSPMRFSMP